MRMRAHTCSSSKQTEHSRGDCPCRLCPVRNVWRCAPFLKVLCAHCISRSGPRPPTRSAYSTASPLSPWLQAPCHTHTQSRPNDHPLRHQVTRCPPGLTWLGLPVRSDGLRVRVKRSAVSTTEVGEEPSSLSPPHAPTHMHVSPRTTLSPAPACVRERKLNPTA